MLLLLWSNVFAFVGFFVCLCFKITQKVVDWYNRWNYRWVSHGPETNQLDLGTDIDLDSVFPLCQHWVITAFLGIEYSYSKCSWWMFGKFFWIVKHWNMEQLITFWTDPFWCLSACGKKLVICGTMFAWYFTLPSKHRTTDVCLVMWNAGCNCDHDLYENTDMPVVVNICYVVLIQWFYSFCIIFFSDAFLFWV